jgi:hypothetical protein
MNCRHPARVFTTERTLERKDLFGAGAGARSVRLDCQDSDEGDEIAPIPVSQLILKQDRRSA